MIKNETTKEVATVAVSEFLKSNTAIPVFNVYGDAEVDGDFIGVYAPTIENTEESDGRRISIFIDVNVLKCPRASHELDVLEGAVSSLSLYDVSQILGKLYQLPRGTVRGIEYNGRTDSALDGNRLKAEFDLVLIMTPTARK